MITKINRGKSDQAGKNAINQKNKSRKFARCISADDRNSYVSAREAVILPPLKRIQASLEKAECPEALQGRMMRGVIHEARPSRGQNDISKISNQECCYYQESTKTKLPAGSLIPIQKTPNNDRGNKHEVNKLPKFRQKWVLQSIGPKDRAALPHRQVPPREDRTDTSYLWSPEDAWQPCLTDQHLGR